MNGLGQRRIEKATAEIRIGLDEPCAVAFEGILREREDSWLNAFVDELHGAAMAARLAEVVLDLRKLRYANAAFLKALLRWHKIAREGEHRYELKMKVDPGQRWQLMGLPALRLSVKEGCAPDGSRPAASAPARDKSGEPGDGSPR